MRTLIVLSATLFLTGGSAHAQVINGEGTYEGSTLHDPPPETVAGTERRTDDKKPAAAATSRQDRRD